MLPEEAIGIIKQMYEARSIDIEAGSILQHLLEETQAFVDSTRDRRGEATGAETDDAAVSVAEKILKTVRLGIALREHRRYRTSKLTETLATLSGFRVGPDQHDEQFDESEFELHAASQFVGCGHRVSFVDTKRPSRFEQKVEFLLAKKWSVECKRPRVPARILPNVRAAVSKLDERDQPGIVCLAVENALAHRPPFREIYNVEEVQEAVSEEFSTWWQQEETKIQEVLSGSNAHFLIVNYTALTYMHDTGMVGLPSLRLGVSKTGEWIQTDVCHECVRRLARNRAIATGQWTG